MLHHYIKNKNTGMRNTLLFLTLFLVSIGFVSCSDDDNCACNDASLLGKWEATDFLSLESVMYSKDNDYNPVIEFRADGTMEILLDVNRCGGNFELGKDSTIQMGNAGCTEACCDSQFSQKFVAMLPRVETYDMDDSSLRLMVSEWGWINLVRSTSTELGNACIYSTVLA